MEATVVEWQLVLNEMKAWSKVNSISTRRNTLGAKPCPD